METFTRDGLTFDVADSPPSTTTTGVTTGVTTGAAGPGVVVCLHGFPQDARSFAAVTPRLTRAGLRVLAPDQRGYSPGARPTGRRAYALTELVDDVLALLDAAGARSAHVVGHDWGGAVAWALAAWHPARVSSLTVLSTPHPAALRRAAVRSSQALNSSYMAAFQLPAVPERLLLAGGGRFLRESLRRSGLPVHLAERYVERLREPGALTAALSWYRAIPLGGPPVGRVQVPVTYLHGWQDPFFSRAAVTGTGDHVVGPFRRRVLDTGHWVPESDPAAVATAVLERARPG